MLSLNMSFPSSLLPSTLSKIFFDIFQKVLVKTFIKALSKPIIRESYVALKFVYRTLTENMQSTTSKTEKSGGGSGDGDNKATEELSLVIDDLLNQLGTKFSTISEELLDKSKPLFSRHLVVPIN
jgi:hypothetical protein